MSLTAMFDAMYRGEYRNEQGAVVEPPWEIGTPQPAVIALLEAGRIAGRVLDVGCGTGENAVLVGAAGHSVVGIDAAPTAIERAKAKAVERGVTSVRFEVGDATELTGYSNEFDTVLDIGLLHGLPPEQQPAYVAALRRICRPGALVHVLCFAQVGADRLAELFNDGWQLAEPVPTPLVGRVPNDQQFAEWAGAAPGEFAELPSLLATATRT